VRAMERMTVGRRFAALVALCAAAIALPAGLVSVRAWEDARVAARESAGVGPARVLLGTVQKVQQHRGMAAVWLGGDEKMADARRAKHDEVQAGIAAFDLALDADGARGSRLGKAWQEVRAKWLALADDVNHKRVDGPRSSAAHGALIAVMLEALDEVLAHWELALDPSADSLFMVVGGLQEAPRMIEYMGQLRARGANLLAAGGTPSPGDRARLQSLEGNLVGHFGRMRAAFERSVAANAETGAAIDGTVRKLDELGRSGIEYAQRHVIRPETLTLASAEYYTEVTRVIDGMYASLALVLDRLDTMLAQRATSARAVLWGGAAGVLLLFGAALTIAVATGRWMRRQLGAEPHELRDAAARVAEGDLASAMPLRRGDTTSVMAAMQRMRESLATVVGSVRGGADAVATASTQIAHGNQDLSSRTEQQASALEQTAASMEELGGTVRQTHEHAQAADQLARGASAVAQQGGEAVGQVVSTMRGIQQASDRISEITGTIDGIAFQTNILALNAAVEAARAGEQGRGFAVVAGEVRSLAQRAGEAAREIKSLIAANVERVQEGTDQVDRAGRTMQEIVDSIRRVTDLISEIAGAAAEQSAGVSQVGQAVSQMDRATQQNAALVEESAAAAESLKAQAAQLVQAVAAFRLAGG